MFVKDKLNLDGRVTINEFTESERGAFAKLNSYLLAGVEKNLIADALVTLNTLSSSAYSLGHKLLSYSKMSWIIRVHLERAGEYPHKADHRGSNSARTKLWDISDNPWVQKPVAMIRETVSFRTA